MKTTRRIAALVALLLTLALAACGGDAKDPFVATVGEEGITDSQLTHYTYLYAFVNGIDTSWMDEKNLAIVKKMVLEDLIALRLMELKYKDDPTVLPADAEQAAVDFVEMVHREEVSDAYMKKYGVTDEALKDFHISQHFSVRFFDDMRAAMEPVTDADVETYYKENPTQFVIDEVTAGHILVAEEGLAEEILTKLRAGGDFESLAEEYSIDGSASEGGSLGTFGRGAMVPEFEEAVFALAEGEVSDVVATQFGYHIIRVTEKRQGTETLEEARDTIRANLESLAITELYVDWVGALREEFGVSYGEGYERE